MNTFASALSPADTSIGRPHRESRHIFPAKGGKLPFIEQCLAVATTAPVIRTMNLKIAAAQWVHPLLRFRTDAGVREAAVELEAAE